MKHIKIKDVTKTVKFMEQDLEIKQLTVKQVKDLQSELSKIDAVDSLKTLSLIFKATVVGCEDMSDEDFEKFPISALTELSTDILKFNGLGATDDAGKSLGK